MILNIIKRFSILTLAFYIPVIYLPLYITGIRYVEKSFLIEILVSAIIALSISIVIPILDFITIKKRFGTRTVLSLLLTIVSLLILQHYFKVLIVNPGVITIDSLHSILSFSISVNSIVTFIAASIFFSIWGIISNNLLDY